MKTFSYCKSFDHTIEQCPQLIAKWKARTVRNPNPVQNPNLNSNQNIQMIYVEPREATIIFVIRGGATNGADQSARHGKLQV